VDLREQLKRRLDKVYHTHLPLEPHDIFIQVAGIGAVADECIRQMEWARHECPFEWAGTPDPITKAGSADAILSIAPDGWTPPKDED
jgi:hypothetical protein